MRRILESGKAYDINDCSAKKKDEVDKSDGRGETRWKVGKNNWVVCIYLASNHPYSFSYTQRHTHTCRHINKHIYIQTYLINIFQRLGLARPWNSFADFYHFAQFVFFLYWFGAIFTLLHQCLCLYKTLYYVIINTFWVIVILNINLWSRTKLWAPKIFLLFFVRSFVRSLVILKWLLADKSTMCHVCWVLVWMCMTEKAK